MKLNREEIKKIGLEAGISEFAFGLASEEAWQQVERFVALVAAAEREACAKLAEDEYRDFPPFCGVDGGEIVANDIAAEIRARGQE